MARSHDDSGRTKTFTRRTLLLGGGQAALLGLLGGRLYYLQVQESDRYKMLAEDNRINLRLLAPPRGRIVDRFGVPLAVNVENYRLMLVREQMPDFEETLEALTQIIPLTDKELARIRRDVLRKRAFVPVSVRDHLTWRQVSRIEVNAPDLPGISIEAAQSRHHPQAAMSAQVLGYVAAPSESDLSDDPLLELPGFRIGKTGVERIFDTQLRGQAGSSQVEVNAGGRIIRELARDQGKPGRELVLTIDSGLQSFMHQRLVGEKAAAGAVIDIESGDILALTSVPSYDPNEFSRGLTASAWRDLTTDPLRPLNNRALSGLYAPGSTFKMIVALAALEAGVSPHHRVYCRGVVQLGNARFHCWKRQGHGWMDMHDGIKRSCDSYFYDISRRAGIDRISAMARRFGLGAPVGVELEGEKAGLVPTRDWKQAIFGEPWQPGETLVTSIGQGFILTTPLQLAVMTARLASGRAVQPRIARGFLGDDSEAPQGPEFPELSIPEQHLKIVRGAMDAVVNNNRGTAFRRRIKEEGWEMAGKTGTSQVRRITLAERRAGVIKNEDLPWHRRDHALFVGYAPVYAPRYACAVIVEHGGGGSKAAAPIVRDILTVTQRRDPTGSGAMPLLASRPVEEG